MAKNQIETERARLSIWLRSKLGLAQNELASLLGCSRSVINMAELGERKLPFAVQQRMLVLVREMQATAEEGTAKQGKGSLETSTCSEAFLLQQKKDISWKVQKAERTLETMKASFEKVCHAEQQLNTLRIPNSDAWRLHMNRGIELKLERCAEKKAACNLERQFQLEAKLVGLRAQLLWIEALRSTGESS